MPSEPRWLTVEHAIEFDRLAVAATGEPFSIVDHGLLESAMAAPVNHWHYGEHNVPILAAKLLLALARNHAFLQGNKRVGLLAADAFLAINGYELACPDSELADLILAVIAREISEDEFVADFASTCGIVFTWPAVRGKRVVAHGRRRKAPGR